MLIILHGVLLQLIFYMKIIVLHAAERCLYIWGRKIYDPMEALLLQSDYGLYILQRFWYFLWYTKQVLLRICRYYSRSQWYKFVDSYVCFLKLKYLYIRSLFNCKNSGFSVKYYNEGYAYNAIIYYLWNSFIFELSKCTPTTINQCTHKI